MKQILRFVRALLQRHWVSFLLACVVPLVVGLIAVATMTVITDLHYADFLYNDYYNDVIRICEDNINESKEGFSYNDESLYKYSRHTETEKLVNNCTVVGKKSGIGLELKSDTTRAKAVTVIDYEYWKHFPARIYKGGGFTGTRYEILLDICNINDYEIGKEYEFDRRDDIINAVGIDNPTSEVLGTVKATVVGFTRTSDYLDFAPYNGLLCVPYEDWQDIGVKKNEFRYIKIPPNLLQKLWFKYVPNDTQNEEFEDRFKEDLRSGDFYVPNEYMAEARSKGFVDWTIGSLKRASTLSEEDINKFSIVLFLAIALSLLAIISELCLNGSMLKCTERVAIRSGLRYKDVSIGYVIKAVLQFLISSVIMLGVVLYNNHKTSSLLIMEHMWAGIVAILALGLISWSIDSIRLYLSQRRKD